MKQADSNEQRVWIAQCLCPDRHCILATAGEARDAQQAEEVIGRHLRDRIKQAVASGVLNPWCGLCNAGSETWRYELGHTAFGSMEEAAPALRQQERSQGIMRELWGDMRRSD